MELIGLKAVAKTIIFRSLDKIIQQSDWDEGGGTKAINVTYTIAWLQRRLRAIKKEFNFGKYGKSNKSVKR